ncbi:AraC family transcriptional regulator [Cohnella endophytica]|uniref:AraC family transcriptional regulator n=1 Tax=Cohnella endophytica TaxID=2419778 RepID=A0A494XBP3_9BACL|nr:AraC family transcriptional regulator [Cohnella endophytica]RKP47948.1 AraC family transcriptional regulator [Cohnella endophytica]
MDKKLSPDLQPTAVGFLRYRLLDVRVLRGASNTRQSERNFIETKSHLLLLSNAHGGKLVIDGRLHVLRPGSLFVCAPGQLVELTNFADHPLELLLIYFQAYCLLSDETTVTGVPLQVALPFPCEAAVTSASTAGHLFGAISSSWNNGAPSSLLRCEAGLLELLGLSLDYREQQAELALEASRMELERHYASEITIDSLAKIAGLSRYHFMRLFKERYGRGVMEYRTDLRLKDAKQRMGEPNSASLGEIVFQVGYKSESYFSSLFKKQTGIAPAIYQRNQKRKIAAYSWINFGQILALQTIPFAAPMDHYWTSHYRNKYEYEVKVPLSHQYEFNLSALRTSQPDAIVGIVECVPAEEQDKLRTVAPALFLSWDDDWRNHLSSVGNFLEQEDAAIQWLDRYDRKASSLRERLQPIVGKDSLIVLAVGANQMAIWGHQAGTVFYDDLGFTMPEAIRAFKWIKSVEADELTEINADRIVLHVDQSPAAQARGNNLFQTEAWKKLRAVKNRKIHKTSSSGCYEAPWNEYSADALGRFLNEVPRLFEQ